MQRDAKRAKERDKRERANRDRMVRDGEAERKCEEVPSDKKRKGENGRRRDAERYRKTSFRYRDDSKSGVSSLLC